MTSAKITVNSPMRMPMSCSCARRRAARGQWHARRAGARAKRTRLLPRRSAKTASDDCDLKKRLETSIVTPASYVGTEKSSVVARSAVMPTYTRAARAAMNEYSYEAAARARRRDGGRGTCAATIQYGVSFG